MERAPAVHDASTSTVKAAAKAAAAAVVLVVGAPKRDQGLKSAAFVSTSRAALAHAGLIASLLTVTTMLPIRLAVNHHLASAASSIPREAARTGQGANFRT